ncbi:hypothetical protein FE782_00615 [Paenibacillus antri]|uniref:Heparin-sulfate lyase N-terminal domain-containing protein n=1 Tax=Paenibacillus antri TaxID=2582848 RepID=A0A5R9GLB8_9BACL|nr:hypothetical protein [Paenibacillus antri]TLS53893.1 hypothetical protein FE782_00615 [Paenibacillus antri]
MNRQSYLKYIQEAVLEARRQYEKQIESWKSSFDPNRFLGMYSPPGIIPQRAHTEGFLYRVTGEREYGEQAKRMLLAIEEFKAIVPADLAQRHPEYAKGIPSFETMFQGTHYIQGYLFMKGSELLSEAETSRIEDSIRSAIHGMLHYPEWGAHNRSMLRVFALSLAITALGDTEETRQWAQLRDLLAEESYGRWSIEDSELYLPLWLISCIVYAEQTGKEADYFAKPQTKYYFDFMTRAITPYGLIPDYGDAMFNSHWLLWSVYLEKGAARYRCGHMKYAAKQIREYGMGQLDGPPSLFVAAYFTYAYLWGDDTLDPVKPDWKSELLLEDVIGKKIVFRDGAQDDSSYMLYNYRDEGDYAFTPREYLRRTINAPAEKAHHGHADENSILMLVKEQNILLHDGGYRDQAPNGKYRADIYHNRLVFRSGRPDPEGSMYDFIHDDGTYRRVSTELLHFHSFDGIEYSRTRLNDPYRQVIWDRCITYLKEDGAYIVVDWTMSQADQSLSTVNLWHPGTVMEANKDFYVGQVRHIHSAAGDPKPFANRRELALLIEFPGSSRPTGHERIRRCYAESDMIFEADSRYIAAGGMNCFVTTLTPIPVRQNAQEFIGRTTVTALSPANDQLAVAYSGPDKTNELTYKLDLNKGFLDVPHYPKYSWDQSRLSYGSIETDADFSCVTTEGSGSRRYGFVNGIGLRYKGSDLFVTPAMSSYQFQTGTYHEANHKWRAWHGSIR